MKKYIAELVGTMVRYCWDVVVRYLLVVQLIRWVRVQVRSVWLWLSAFLL